ncbi:MAG: right-handed parallel beta-helix repeat-containing protein [Chloroflexota bacterium]
MRETLVNEPATEASGDEKIVVYVPYTEKTTLNVNISTNSFERASGSFVDDGFVLGQRFTAYGFNDNQADYLVADVDANRLTVAGPLVAGDETGSGDEQLVVQGSRGEVLDQIFKMRDGLEMAAIALGPRIELGPLVETLIDKVVTGGTIEPSLVADLFRAYLYNWLDEINEGVRHWGEVGLGFTRALFDPQSRRDVQNEAAKTDGPDTLENELRADTEAGVGFMDVLLSKLDDPNGDRSTADSFINKHLLPMFGLPEELGVLRVALQDFSTVVGDILDPLQSWLNPLEATIQEARESVVEFIKDEIAEAFGFSFEVLEFLTDLSSKMDLASITVTVLGEARVVPIFKPGDHERLDALLGITPPDHHNDRPGALLSPVTIAGVTFTFYADVEGTLTDNAEFNKETFAAYANSVTLARTLVLMENPVDGETTGANQLSELFSDVRARLGLSPSAYEFSLLNLHGAHGGNVLTATLPGVSGTVGRPWLLSIDPDHVWRTDSMTTTTTLFRVSTVKTGTVSPAVWETMITPGNYRIYATWLANVTQKTDNLVDPSLPDQQLFPATNATYTVKDGETPFGTQPLPVDQHRFAGDTEFLGAIEDGGLDFRLLGTFAFLSNTLRVELSNLANGNVVAGPILIDRVGGVDRRRIQNNRNPETLKPTLPDEYTDNDAAWTDFVYATGTGNNPLWESGVLRPVFRELFIDWENGALDFPALGDTPSPDPNLPSVVLYNTAESALTDDDRFILDGFASFLNANPLVHADVVGHTDRVGTPESNQTLSEARANLVSAYLQSKGVPLSQLTVAGFGETQPAFPTADEVPEPKNRRVELTAIVAPTPLPSHATPFGPAIADNDIVVPIPEALEQLILDGLNRLVEFADTLDNLGPFTTPLPVVDRTLAELIDLPGRLRTEVQNPVVSYFANDTTPTLHELFDVMEGSAGSDSPVRATSETMDALLRFELDLRAMVQDLLIELDPSLGLALEASATLDLAATIQLAFGVDLSPDISLPILDRFFILAAPLSLSVDVAARDLNFGGQVGSVGMGVLGGSIDLHAEAGVAFNDPNLDGKITLTELRDTPVTTLVSVSPTVSLDASLPVFADPFALGGLTVELAGLVTLTESTADFTMAADLAGTLVPGFEILAPSQVRFDDETGFSIDASARAFGANLHLNGALDPGGAFEFIATADDVAIGPLTVDLAGTLTRTIGGGEIDYYLQGFFQGELVPGLAILPGSVVRLGRDEGLEIDASANAFGATVHITGDFNAGNDFSFAASADPFEIAGATVTLSGEVTRAGGQTDWALSATIVDWEPVSFITVDQLQVTLDQDGIGIETTADIAGVDDIHLAGDYRFGDDTYRVIADLPVEWTIVSGVELTDVFFTFTNRNDNDTAGEVRVVASADLELFGADFAVAASVSSRGFWAAATPDDPDWSPIPGVGLDLDYAFVVLSSYDFVIAIETAGAEVSLGEVPGLTAPEAPNQRSIEEGVNLVAASTLPDNIPAFGGSEVQIAGLIGTSLPDLVIEARIVMGDAPVIANLLAFDAFGLRITGAPSLSVFGQGRILGTQNGLGQDVPVEAALTIDLLAGSLDGSLSLLDTDNNPDTAILTDVLVPDLDIYGGSGSFGIVFGSPLPTIGLALDIGIPEVARDFFLLPPRASAAVKVSPTQPIVAFSFLDWQPLGALGIDLTVDELSVAFAPQGGFIGTREFAEGFSAEFVADILGTDVEFFGSADLNNLDNGIVLTGFVEEFTVAGVRVTGAGDDGAVGTSDDGLTFTATLLPPPLFGEFSFSGGIFLPGAGNNAFVALTGGLTEDGLFVEGEFELPNFRSVLGIGGGAPTVVDISGEIRDDGLLIAGSIRDWELFPLIFFDGALRLEADANGIEVAVEADASFVIGSIELAGELVVSSSGFDLLLEAHADIGIPGALAVEMDGLLDTRNGFVMELAGAVEILGQPVVSVDADLVVLNSGEWQLDVRMDVVDLDFKVPLVKADVGYFAVNLTLSTEFHVSEAEPVPIVNFTVDIDVTLDVLGHNEHAEFTGTLPLDLGTGAIRIPDVRPVIHLGHTLPWKWHPFHTRTLEIRIADPAVSTDPVGDFISVERVSNAPGAGEKLVIRGTTGMERLRVEREQTRVERPLPFGGIGRVPLDRIVVWGAIGEDGAWTRLLTTDAAGLSLIDIDLGGARGVLGGLAGFRGNGDEIEVSRSVTIPTLIRGSAFDDVLSGGGGPDIIFGGGGEDELFGNAGSDEIHGGSGIDIVDGGAGDDLLFGDAGRDRLLGGEGNDTMRGGSDDDELEGGAGNDSLFGEAGMDRLSGGADNDTLSGGADDNVLDGGEGLDQVLATADTDYLLTNARLTGLSEDILWSVESARLTGGALDKVFDLSLWSGTVALDGGGGLDTLVINRNADIVLDDSSFTVSTGGSGTLTGIERAHITGGPAANRLDASGFSGQATLLGRAGDDTLLGGSGADFLDGGSGTDLLVGGAGDDELRAGAGTGDTLHGGGGDDLIIGSDDGADLISGDEGRDHIFGHGGNDTLAGGPDADIMDGGGGDDLISGGGGADLILGGAHHDIIYGHAAAGTDDDGAVDYLYGDFGTDANEAGSGGDRLFGGAGNDLMFGEGGDDFVDPGDGLGNFIAFGAGESAVPGDFVSPAPQPAPALAPVTDDATVPEPPPPAALPEPRPWRNLALINLAVVNPAVFGGTTYYVNDGVEDVDDDGDVTAPGSADNDGRSRASPMQTVQQVLNAHDLNLHDQIIVFSGSYGSFTVGAEDSGVRIAGRTDDVTIAGIVIDGASDVTIQDLTVTPRRVELLGLFPAITVSNGSDVVLTRNLVEGGILISGGDGIRVADNEIAAVAGGFLTDTGVTVTGGATGVTIDANTIVEGSRGVAVTGTAAVTILDNVFEGSETGIALLAAASGEIRDNTIEATGTGIAIGAAFTGPIRGNAIDGGAVGVSFDAAGASATVEGNVIHGGVSGIAIRAAGDGRIAGNDVSGGTIALHVAAAFGGVIERNDLHGAYYGAWYSAPALLGANRIFDNEFGVYTTVTEAAGGLGFVGAAMPNEIYGNFAGLYLEGGRAQGQHIFANSYGVFGNGVLGGDDFDHANLIELNEVGVAFQGVIQFNRITRNTIGVSASTGQDIAHNLIYRNLDVGILVGEAADVDVIGNTLYAPSGDNLRIENFETETSLRVHGNIFWAEGGYNISVDRGSVGRVESDGNLFHATGDGRLVLWAVREYNDILDWQVETGLDLHSVGRTDIDPEWSEPRFVNRALDDYRVQSLVAGQRFSSPSIDAAGAPDGMGAYGAADGGRDDVGAPRIALRSPDLYTDWERDEFGAIRWQTYGNSAGAAVRIDLYQDEPDGPAFLTTITPSTPDDGEFSWAPEQSGIDFGTHGLRIQISIVGFEAALDRSHEVFSVPEDGNVYYVDDGSDENDEYTPGATGDHRHTGKIAAAPKPGAEYILGAYDVIGGTIQVDAGDYETLGTIRISGATDFGLGLDEGFVLTGPTDSDREASLAPWDGLPFRNPGWVVIELQDADFMTLAHLTLANGRGGLRVHGGSDSFSAHHLNVEDHAGHGIDIEGSVTSLADIEVEDSTGDGIRIVGSVGELIRINVYNNAGDGIWVDGPVGVVRDSQIGNNGGTGLALLNAGTVHVERVEASGNAIGIRATGGGATPAVIGHADLGAGLGNLVDGNRDAGIEASGNVVVAGNFITGNGDWGLSLNGGRAEHNVVTGNLGGISAVNAAVVGNRVADNEGTGVFAQGASPILENVIEGNIGGIHAVGFGGRIANNVIVGNDRGGESAGITIQSGVGGLEIANNTIAQRFDAAIRLESGSQDVRLRNNIVSVADGYGLFVSGDSELGLLSDFNLFHTTGNARVGFWQGDRASLADWQTAAFVDQISLAGDPLFVDAATGDFHVQSLYGSFHGGSLAPVRDEETGLPVMAPFALTMDAMQSPAIDRGDSASPFGNEPTPNGGFVNLGAYGNTAQASLSPAQYVLVTRPGGGESWPVEQTFAVDWRSHDRVGTVDVELWRAGGTEPVLVVADDTANDGEFLWTLPPDTLFPGDDYFIRVVRASGVADSSNAFAITAPVTMFYVNDGSVNATGDWTSAPGSDANDGLSAATPKASIRAVLEAYDLRPGDVIRVDSGTYGLLTNIVIGAQDSGVTIVGYYDALHPARAAVLDRDNRAAGADVFELAGADDVTLERLTLRDAEWAVRAWEGADSDRLTVRDSVIDSVNGGIRLDRFNDGAVLAGNTIDVSAGYGSAIELYGYEGGGHVVSGNRVVAFGGSFGIYVTAPGVLIEGNDITEVIGYPYGGTGIRVDGQGSSAAERTVVRGNFVHNVSAVGIEGRGNALVEDNEVLGAASWGISVIQGAEVRDNDVHDNAGGIYLSGGTVVGNRIFHNTGSGIHIDVGGTVTGNSIYGNATGIFGTVSFWWSQRLTGLIENNVIYDNVDRGIRIGEAAGFDIINNTIYQPVGDAIRVEGGSANVHVRNNILQVGTGTAVSLEGASTGGFRSDYNDLFATGAGRIAAVDARGFTSLADWFYEFGQDQHSQTGDPQFVDADGADGILGWEGADHGADDDFRVLAGSPTIDAGDPADLFANEPAPNGGRVNQGAHGNTAEAASSAPQIVQVLSPNGLEKIETGSEAQIRWRTWGLTGTPSFALDVSLDAGTTWSALAAGLGVDAAGHGAFSWTPDTASETALVRVRTESVSGPADISDGTFVLANDGTDYYVNDASTEGDVFTTAPGNNAASGKRADAPMASLTALIGAYDLDAGDVIHVDTGTYHLVRNVRLEASDSGVTIEGPEGGAAVLDRDNRAAGADVFELAGADDVTLERLTLRDAEWAVRAWEGADSDRLTVRDSVIDSVNGGIRLDRFNDGAVLAGNTIDVSAGYGSAIELYGYEGGGHVVSGNRVVAFGGSFGIYVTAPGVLIEGNDITEVIGYPYGGTGIRVDGQGSSAAERTVVRGNFVHNVSAVGIEGRGNALVEDNEVLGAASWGISVIQGAEVRDNDVHDNAGGIYLSGGTVVGNRIFHNTGSGIHIDVGGTVTGNSIYGNATGIFGTVSFWWSQRLTGLIENNVIYDNVDRGIRIGEAAGFDIINNTIYQPVGDAIRVEGGSANVHVRNNIVCVDAGYDLSVAPDSQSGFSSDHNLLHGSGPTAFTGIWNNTGQDTLSDWQAASGQDAQSVAADPLFRDRDGADNILGYSTTLVRDGGADDNFHLRQFSPAIDRGDALAAPLTDADGLARSDDDGTPNLGTPIGSFVDLGAFEFGGSSLDTTPPTIDGTTIRRGTPEAPLTQIDVVFSEPVDPVDALAPANYELREAGADGVFGTDDDGIYALAPAYSPGSMRVVLDVIVPDGGLLPEGNFRFRVSGSTSIHDLSGLRLDGDGDGIEGGDDVAANQTPVLAPLVDQAVQATQTLAFAASALDPDGDDLIFSLDAGAPAGAAIEASGVFSWTPTALQGGAEYFVTVRVTDSGNPALSDAQTVRIIVAESTANVAPTAHDDSATVAEDSTNNVIDVLTNDSLLPDADETLVVTAVGAAAHGTTALVSGEVQYTPTANYFGIDSFTYTISDGHGGIASATVAITVTPVNDAPSFTVGPNQTIAEDSGIQTLDNWMTNFSAGPANESAQTLTFLVTGNTNPSLFAVGPAVSSTGTLTYTSAANANGTATLSLVVRDSGGTANGGVDANAGQTFTITVTPVNDAPEAVNDSYSVITGNALTVPAPGVLTDDTDIDTSAANLGMELVTNVANGILIWNASGGFMYTANDGFTGIDTFTYRVNDGAAENNLSNVATVTINVQSAMQPPLVINGTGGNDIIRVEEQTGGLIKVTLNGVVTNYTLLPSTEVQVFGMAGNDQIFLAGLTRNATVDGGDGHDLINAARVLASQVTLTLLGGSGNDIIIGSAGDDLLDGGSGNDLLLGGAGNDRLNGGSGNDILLGGIGNDVLDGDDGHDILLGGSGDDFLRGGKGKNILIGGPGNDKLDGGPGLNVVLDWNSTAQKLQDNLLKTHPSWVRNFVG